MPGSIMKKHLAALGCSLLMLSSAAFAVPSLQQIEQSIAQRDWQRADTQLSQVVDAYPNNAHARYLYAQVLDREGRASDALAQLQRAKSLDPQLRFADASRFAQTEARIRADASRMSSTQPGMSSGMATQSTLAPGMAPAVKHGPSIGMWIGIGLLIAAIALVLRWTLRRARSTDDQRADDERRMQLKRATDVLNDVRPLKLDARLSTAPGAAALTGEIETVEAQARELVEALSNAKNPVPPYRIDELEQQFASVKARVEGRPDPVAPPAAPATPAAGSGSVYAQEADRLTGAQGQPYPPPYPPQQQPPVVIQQGGGGIGSGMGGLLTGVLLGQAMSGGHDRVVERDVIVDDERRQRDGDPGVDLGHGDGTNWDSGNDGGVDLGGGDDNGDWSNT